MTIERIVVGPLDTNCYIIKENKKCLIIDPGDEPELIIKHINEEVLGLVITHHHFDHVGAVNILKEKYKCPVYDINNLNEGICNIDIFTFECIYFPGHKEDLIALYFVNENVMFVGDFVFENSIGRMDLPGGNTFDMINSLKKLLKYNELIKLLPGHGNCTSIKEEKESIIEFINYYENLI